MLQFITHHTDRYNTIESAEVALEGGCRWIQLRLKNASQAGLEITAVQLKALCWETGATFIIDDHVDVCQRVNADGVHLGKSDMCPAEARKILGEKKLIGGTANTFEDIKSLVEKGVDYIGLGPFRFTTTKENLSQILGLEGLAKIRQQCQEADINIPIVAIGGITKEDIPAITKLGYGIALSSTILQAEDPVEETKAIIDLMKNIL